jgi:hypothetical protein
LNVSITNNEVIAAIVGTIFLLLIGISVWLINAKFLNRLENDKLTLLFFFILAIINPIFIFFTPFHVVTLLLIWGEYLLINKRNFTAMLFFSSMAILYPPAMWILPLCIFLCMKGSMDKVRDFAKIISGVILPFIYFFAGDFVITGNFDYCLKHLSPVININFLPYNTLDIPTIFLILIIAFVFFRSIFYYIQNISINNIIISYIMKVDIYILLFYSILFTLFYDAGINLSIAPFLAIIFSNYFFNNINKYFPKIELLVLIVSIVIYRAVWFI